MKRITIIMLVISSLVLVAFSQKKEKPWTEWTEKEVNKMLNDSAWGQTQTETNTSEMFFSPTGQGRISGRPLDTSPGSTGSNDRGTQGALNQATNLNYRVRFLTAKPIRQALARRAQLSNPQLAEQLAAFAEQKTDQFIVVTVDVDSSDRRFSGPAMQIFKSFNTGTLKNNTYLEVKSGQRVFLQEYIPPSNDGMGAKYVFPRLVDGKAFVDKESGYIRFYSEMSKDFKIQMRFNVSKMVYGEELEY